MQIFSYFYCAYFFRFWCCHTGLNLHITLDNISVPVHTGGCAHAAQAVPPHGTEVCDTICFDKDVGIDMFFTISTIALYMPKTKQCPNGSSHCGSSPHRKVRD